MGLVTIFKEEVIAILSALAQSAASAQPAPEYLKGYHQALRDVAISMGKQLTIPGEWERLNPRR